jgi:PAS domain S-box-containing protein
MNQPIHLTAEAAPTLSQTHRFLRTLTLWALALILGFGWLAATRTNRELRADMLQQARLVAQALSINNVKALTGTEADRSSADYQRLKAQLVSVGPANPNCKWFYLIGRKPAASAASQAQRELSDDTIFFFVDSDAADTLDTHVPGQIYNEVPAGYRPVFDTKDARVVGPVTNRWGQWVSALVPLIDPDSGAVLAVLGMDIEARTWQWDVASRVALPVGLMLVLLIVVVAAIYAAHPLLAKRVSSGPKLMLWRLLPPLAAIVSLLMIAAGTLLWQQQRQQLAKTNAADIAAISSNLRLDLRQEATAMAATSQSIAADTGVQKALRAGDSASLLSTWQPIFAKQQRENQVTHLYFLNAQRECLLRVHHPELRGDLIDRFTAVRAERSGRTASGIELGKLGTLTLRVVQPVFADTQLVGYVELGKELEPELQTLHQRSGNQVTVLIRKSLLDRQSWEQGMHMLGRKADWDALPYSVPVYASQGRLPNAFVPMANQAARGGYSHDAIQREIDSDGRHWWVSATPIKDVAGVEVGDMLTMRDMTVAKEAFARLMILSGTVGALVLVLLSGIYVLLSHTDAGIRAQQEELRRSEEMFKSMVETVPLAIILSDESQHLTHYVNPTMVDLFGYTHEDIPTIKQWWNLAYPDPIYRRKIAEEWTRHVDHALANKTAVEPLEVVITCKDGSTKTISWGYITLGGKNYSYGLDLTARKLAEEALRESLREKEALLREIHHRVKNNLQIISSLLRLQSGKTTNAIAKISLLDMQNRVHSMALIHEHLYLSENLAAIDLAVYLRSLCSQLFRTLVTKPGSIHLHLNLSPVILAIDQAIPCGLLVNELVTNALKHAFPADRGGDLWVDLHFLPHSPCWHLRVADNGVGLPPDFDLAQLSSLGLQLVINLARQLDGDVQIGAGPGTVFEVQFKVPRKASPQG